MKKHISAILLTIAPIWLFAEPIETLEKIIGHAKAEVVASYFRQGKLDL